MALFKENLSFKEFKEVFTECEFVDIGRPLRKAIQQYARSKYKDSRTKQPARLKKFYDALEKDGFPFPNDTLDRDDKYYTDFTNNIGDPNKLASTTPEKKEYYLFIYYWFHASCSDSQYAEDIDAIVLEKYPEIQKEETDSYPSSSDDNPFNVTYQERHYFRNKQNPEEKPKKLFEELESFASNEDAIKVWAISGAAGSGKTRLSHEWRKKSETIKGWDHIVLGNYDSDGDHEREFWKQWTPAHSTLIVIDHLYVYINAFDAMLKRCMVLIKQGALSSKKIRILLIDHVFPTPLDELLSNGRMELQDLDKSISRKLFFNKGQPLDLDVINDLDTIMPVILREAAGEYVDNESVQIALGHLESMKEQKAWHPLFAIITGYTLKKAQEQKQEIDVTAWNRRQLIEHYLFKSTRLPWKLRDDRINGTYASAFIAVATARHGVNFEFLKQHKSNYPLLDIPVSYTKVRNICQNILSVPDIPDLLPPFKPDILGETFFLLFLKDMQKDDDLRDAFKKPFIAMLSQGDETILLNDSYEFIGFIKRLTRNLSNADQNDSEVEAHWQTLLKFLKPEDFPEKSHMRWAVSVALIECAKLIEELHPQKRDKEFNQLLKQIEVNALCQLEQNELLQISLAYVMQYYEWIQGDEKKCQNIALKLFDLCRNFEEIQKSEEGMTALMVASVYGYEDVAQLLIGKKANVNIKNTEGKTALIFAIQNGNEKIVNFLIEKDAMVDTQDNEGMTALMVASFNGHQTIVQLLIAKGAEINIQSKEGETALIIASKQGYYEIAQLLIKEGADLDVQYMGSTALMIVSISGISSIAYLLVEAGAGVNIQHEKGWTALMFASLSGHESIVEILLENNADVNLQDREGATALMFACQNGHESVVQMLINNNANVNLQDNNGNTAFTLACHNNHGKALLLLIAAGAEDVDIDDKGMEMVTEFLSLATTTVEIHKSGL